MGGEDLSSREDLVSQTNDLGSISGTYVELTQAAILNAILFIIGGLWSFISPNGIVNTGEIPTIQFAIIGAIVASHSWIMSFALGASFDVLPFIHKFIPYQESSLKSVQNLNLAGTSIIFLGLIIGDIEIFYKFLLVGMSAFAFQYIHLWNPIKTLFRNNKIKNSDPVGYSGILPGMTIILGSFICIFFGLFSDEIDAMFLSMWLTIGLIWTPICWALILSYFNRRMSWGIISTNQLSSRSIILGIVILVHSFSEVIWYLGQIENSIPYLLRGSLILTLGLMINPHRIIRRSLAGGHYNALIVISSLLIPLIGLFSIYFWIIDENSPRLFVYLGNGFLMIIPIAVGITTGYISTIHEDHLHRRREERKNGWPTSIIVIIATITISAPFLRGQIFENLPIKLRSLVIALPFILALFRMASWWKEELIPEEGSWQRIPMFWNEINEPLDPYEFKSEE